MLPRTIFFSKFAGGGGGGGDQKPCPIQLIPNLLDVQVPKSVICQESFDKNVSIHWSI